MKIIKWFISIALIILGLLQTVSGNLELFLSGILLIGTGSILLPPVQQKLDILPPVRHAIILLFILASMVFTFQFTFQGLVNLKIQKEAITKQSHIDYYNAHREEILKKAFAALLTGEYQSILDHGKKYLSANDNAFNGIYTMAILYKLKMEPNLSSEIYEKLYQQLIELNPNEIAYKIEREKYAQKIKNELKELEDKHREYTEWYGPAPEKNWSGTYNVIRKHLKQVLNDPYSFAISNCSPVMFGNGGWLIGCNYRAKNIYGGFVLNTGLFLVVNGEVKQMEIITNKSQKKNDNRLKKENI